LVPDEFRDQLIGARRLLDGGRPADAAELIEKLLASRPDDPAALVLLGAVRLETREYSTAAELFLRVLTEHPDHAQALLGRGEAMLALAQNDVARAAFRAAVDAADGDREVLAAAYRGLGIAYRRAGDLDKAIRELRKAVAENPQDPLARAQLGDALLAHPEVSVDEARRHLERATRSDAAPALTYLALGQLALIDGDSEGAESAFHRAVERAVATGLCAEKVQALLGLGDAAIAQGNASKAYQYVLDALELAPDRADIYARAGDARRLGNDCESALVCYESALAHGAGHDVIERALAVALEAERFDDVAALAERLERAVPGHPRAQAGLAMKRITAGEFHEADALLTAALHAGDDPEVHIALAGLALAVDLGRGGGGRAAVEGLAALRSVPHDRRARGILAQARARQLGVTGDDKAPLHVVELGSLLQRACAMRSELSDLGGEAQQVLAGVDQPLLITVMGEFSSGKSSFVNAFIGEEVAPTGVTPTTATINVVKYGREPAGRIRYRDGRTSDVRWENLFKQLSALSPMATREIALVELLLPLESLQRVNIVDTPGFNSMIPEHEEVARAFIARADAIIWVFSAGQAGKKSEREALLAIAREGKSVLGVLNKIDQLSAAEVAETVDHIRHELSTLVEVVLPLSARRALQHRVGRSGGGEDDGNFSELNRALEERFLQRARELKEETARRRFGDLLQQALSICQQKLSNARDSASLLHAAASRAAEVRQEYTHKVVPEERRLLVEGAAGLCRRVAREVLELVQPRRLPFGSHTATPPDRDYLVAVLETGFAELLEPSRRRVVQALRQSSRDSLSGINEASDLLGIDLAFDVGLTIDDAVELVEARAFDRCQAYLRGYLRGGYVDTFFRRDLPKIELSEDAIYHALYRDAPDIDGELRAPLAAAGATALGRIADRLMHFAGVADVLAYDIEVGVLCALKEVEKRLGSAA
jgi:tetratricopeptide (TPR) repeat protein/GTPase SAR1 family protein